MNRGLMLTAPRILLLALIWLLSGAMVLAPGFDAFARKSKKRRVVRKKKRNKIVKQKRRRKLSRRERRLRERRHPRKRRGRINKRRGTYTYTIKVRKRDTLGKIAKRYHVRVRDIRRWNRLRSNRVRVGRKLLIKSRAPIRIRRSRIYVVRRGDTLGRIAKRLGTSVKGLRRLNRIRRHLRVGQRLRYYSTGPVRRSLSLGRPSRGRLRDGEVLPRGYGYIVRNPEKSYGTNQTISHIIHCLRMTKRRFRRAPSLTIGNLSRKGGGRLRPHKSHQSGRDVDIAYYYKQPGGKCRLKVVTPRTMDARKTWYLIHCFLKTRDVKRIFVNYNLQKPLYKQARRYFRRGKLRELFQYPNGRGRDTLIKHSPGHNHHFHVRFKCPRGNKKCNG